MFVVNLPVKPYVKRFLENNCGSPVNLSKMPFLNSFFITLLENPLFRRDNAITFGYYTDNVEIIISSDTFYRYGWEMSKSNIIKFNQLVEDKIKFSARSFIGLNSSFGLPVHKCIRKFQELFDYPDEVYPFDTIKKDYQRHGSKLNKSKFAELDKIIQEIFMDNLSPKRDSA